jgi:hypothetical protein
MKAAIAGGGAWEAIEMAACVGVGDGVGADVRDGAGAG